MKRILLKCTECDQTNEIPCDGDNPLFCPDCQSVDTFEEPDEESVPCGPAPAPAPECPL